MLLGRERERVAIDGLLATIHSGRSAVLALVGEAGIGKTSMLSVCGGRRHRACLLRARGVESEMQLPFAGLYELLRPALHLLGRIPAPRAPHSRLRSRSGPMYPVAIDSQLVRRRSACSPPTQRRRRRSCSSMTPIFWMRRPPRRSVSRCAGCSRSHSARFLPCVRMRRRCLTMPTCRYSMSVGSTALQQPGSSVGFLQRRPTDCIWRPPEIPWR